MRNSRYLLLFAGLFCATNALGYNLIGWDWTYQVQPISEPFEFRSGNFPGSFGPTAQVEDAYAAALGRWTSEGGAPSFAYIDGGITNNGSWASDGRNVGQYNANTNGSTLAVAQSWGWGSQMDDCDIRVFGSNGFGNINWSTDPNGPNWNQLDFELTVTHELGHCLGLDHSNAGSAVMFASSASGSPVSARNLAPDDQLGIQAIYGASTDAVLSISGTSYTEIGDGDGLLEPGEQVAFSVSVDNSGSVTATNAFALLTTASTDVLLTSDTGLPATGADQGGFSVEDYDGITFNIDPGCTQNGEVSFDLELLADNYVSAGTTAVSIPVFCDPTAPVDLTLSGTWAAGQTPNVHITGALPGELVYIGRSLVGASGATCPGVLGGACLDLESPVALWTTLNADANGEVDYNPTLPASAQAGSSVYVQAAIPRGVGGDQSVVSVWMSEVIQ